MNQSVHEATDKTTRLTLPTRLALVQLVVTTVIALIVGSVSYWMISRILTDTQSDRLAASSSAIANVTKNFMDQHLREMDRLLSDKAIEKYVQSYNELVLLSHFKKFEDLFETISYANKQGLEEVKFDQNSNTIELQDLSSNVLYIKATAQPEDVHIDDSIDGRKEESIIRLGKFLINYFGEQLGYIEVEIPLQHLAHAVNDFPIAHDLIAVITDRGGQILFAPDKSLLGQQIDGMNWGNTKKEILGSRKSNPIRMPFLDCQDCLVTASTVPDYNWTVYSSMSYENFNRPLAEFTSTSSGVFAFTSALIVILVVLYVRQLIKPVGLVTQMAHDIAKGGQLDRRVEWQSNDDIGDLADSFNLMLKRLEATQQDLKDERAYTEDIIQSMADAAVVTNADRNIIKANGAITDLLGYEPEELIGKPALACIAPDQELTRSAIADDLVSEGIMRSMETVLLAKDNRRVSVSLSGAIIRDSGGHLSGMVFVAKDITVLKQAQARLNHLANHDSLTGLPNRMLLNDRLEQSLARLHWRERVVALMFLDLDRFKLVNDSLGHEAGDHLLKVVAERLTHTVREGDTVARLGGDEFVVVLNDLAAIEDATEIAGKIIKVLRDPIDLYGHSYTATTSIGIALAPDHGDNADTLMKHADTAMYEAKRAGRNAYHVYSPGINEEYGTIFHLEVEMRQALKNDEYRVYYQPLVSAQSRKIIGVEALIRWHSSNGEIRTPDKFLPLAEDTGLIQPIGKWVLEHACQQLRCWKDLGYAIDCVAVNIADRQFRDPNIVEQVKSILTSTRLPAESLHLELTEGILMHDISQATNTLEALKSLGVRISVDDFGTGYSSLAHLKRFSLDTLKIDRSFVAGLPDNNQDATLTEAIIGLATKMDLEVIAEGVESEEQALFLQRSGAHMLQGFLFSRPLPANELEKLLSKQTIIKAVTQS